MRLAFLRKFREPTRKHQIKEKMMKSFTRKNALWLRTVFLSPIGLTAISALGQPTYTRPTTVASPTPKPYLQDIQVPQPNTNPNTTSTPTITKTAMVSPAYPVINDVA